MLRFLVSKASQIQVPQRCFNTSAKCLKQDRREMIQSGQRDISQVDGVDRNLIDTAQPGSFKLPDESTPDQLFDGIPFKELPILHIKVSKNNTLMLLTDYKNTHLIPHSCSREGFKNCRKGTNIAAQTTGISMAAKLIKSGNKTIRVCVSGMGPGRTASVKGLVMGGAKVVSITDTTPYIDIPRRPRAAKSL